MAAALWALMAALLAAPSAWSQEQELPQLDPSNLNPSGVVIATDASSAQMTINQSTERAVIRWSSFSIGKDAEVNFLQPGVEAATLNIVTGTSASTLAGTLTATGSVFLINPHGITITPTGQVNTGGMFLASTLKAVDEAKFLLSDNEFTFAVPEGGTAASVANDGSITARDVVLEPGYSTAATSLPRA